MNYPLVKTLKTVNFMAGKASSLAEIKRHRKQSEWAHGLATPKEDVERRKFRTGKIPCEEIRRGIRDLIEKDPLQMTDSAKGQSAEIR